MRTGVVTAAAGIAAFGFGGVAQAQDGGGETGGITSSALPGTEREDSTRQHPAAESPAAEDTTAGNAEDQEATAQDAAESGAPDDVAAQDSSVPNETAKPRGTAETDGEGPDDARQNVEAAVIQGECDATLTGDDGEPLIVDPGAALGAEGLAGIGTSSGSEPTLVSLPLTEALAGLNLGEDGLVVDSLGQVCDTAQGTVNTLGATTNQAVDGLTDAITPDEPAPEEPGEPEQPGDPQPDPQPEPAPNPERPAPGDGDQNGGDASPAPDAPALPPADQDVPAEPLSPVAMPPAADITVPKAPVGPGMDVPDGGSRPGEQENTTRKSGTARALPQAAETDRTPLVLSVSALLLVVAGLSRAWIARKNA